MKAAHFRAVHSRRRFPSLHIDHIEFGTGLASSHLWLRHRADSFVVPDLPIPAGRPCSERIPVLAGLALAIGGRVGLSWPARLAARIGQLLFFLLFFKHRLYLEDGLGGDIVAGGGERGFSLLPLCERERERGGETDRHRHRQPERQADNDKQANVQH